MANGADLLADLAGKQKSSEVSERQATETEKFESMFTSEAKARLSVTNFDADLKKKLKHYCVENDLTVGGVVEEAVRQYLVT